MADKAANSIRLLLTLRKAGLTQAFDDALILQGEGRIVAPVDPGPSLDGEAGIDLLQLGDGLLRVLVVSGPGVGALGPNTSITRATTNRAIARS
jgi:hypothetical protein